MCIISTTQCYNKQKCKDIFISLLFFHAYNFTLTKLKKYVGRSESKECFAIQRYLLIIGKKQNMQVLSHTFTYFST